MGGVGRGLRKGLRGIGKALKAVSKAIGLQKVLQKLGLTGKHIKHIYLTVQPLSAGYEKDKIKTMLAEGIASGAELSEHMRDSLSNGSGVMLTRYYDYATRRIKTHNFKTKISTSVNIDIPDIDLKDTVEKYKPELKHKPYIMFDASVKPNLDGSLYKFMVQFNQESTMVATAYQYGSVTSIQPDMQIDINIPYSTETRIGTTVIPVICLGELVYEKDGNKQRKSIYIGSTSVPYEVNEKSDFCYFYNADVDQALEEEYSYVALLTANKTKVIQESDITTELDPTDTRIDSHEVKYQNFPILGQDGEYVLEYRETITTIYTDLVTGKRYEHVEVTYHSADMDDGENLEVIWANDLLGSHLGLNVDFKLLAQQEDTNLGSISLSSEELEEKFSFYPYLPLKQKKEYTIDFKHGDPYEGVKDKEGGETDSEAKRDPNKRGDRVKEGTKPRTVQRRLRKKILKTIDSKTKRRYDQASKLLEQSYESLVGQLKHNEKDTECHYSCMLPSVSLNSKVQEVKRYWYHFAKHMYKYIHKNKDMYPMYNTKDILTQSELETYVISLFDRGIIHAGNKVDGKWEIEAKVPTRKQHRTYPAVNSIAAYNDIDGSNLSHSLNYVGIVHFRIPGNIKPKGKRRHLDYHDIRIGRNILLRPYLQEVDCKIIIRGTDASSFSAVYEPISSSDVPKLNEHNFEFVEEYKERPDLSDWNVVNVGGDSNSFGFSNVAEDYFDSTLADNNIAYYTCFCKQVGTNTIDIYAIQGLQSLSLVQDHGCSIGAYEFLYDKETIEGKGFYNMFVMPVCHDVIKRAGLINNTRFSSRVVQRLDFSTYDQYVPWYARSAFKVVLTIIQIVLFVLTIYAGGVGAAVVEAAKQGVYAVVRQVIVNAAIQIAISIAVQQVIKALAKVFGGQIAAILGALAAVAMTVYGTAQGVGIDLPYASQVMLAAPAVTNGANQVMTNLMVEAQKQMEVDTKSYEEAMAKLEEDKNYFEEYVSSGIDTNAFVAALQTRVEKLDTFLERTLTANMNQFADLSFLETSLETAMFIDYEPELDLNWTGIPTDNSVPADWSENIPQQV